MSGSGKFPLVITLLIGIVIIGATGCNSPEAKAKHRARDKINLCWEEQRRKSLTPADQRFIASVCEKLEAEFVRDYGVSAN